MLEKGSVKFDPDNPFIWSSGYRMPVYNDCRLLLGDYSSRKLIVDGFRDVIESNRIFYDMIFGVATAGISPATTLADSLRTSFGYVRSRAKEYGMMRSIEGPEPKNKTVVLIEELISTGRSSARAVTALRHAGAKVNYCLSIFNYDFGISQRIFTGSEPFEEAETIGEPCRNISLVHWDDLLDAAIENGYVSSAQARVLKEWRKDPFANYQR